MRKNFTLIELMAVIVIIFFMVSILLPTLQKVRERTWQITCGNNMKQISLAFSYYTEDYYGYNIPYTYRFIPDTPGGVDSCKSYWNWAYFLAKTYIRNANVFKCPSGIRKLTYSYTISDLNPPMNSSNATAATAFAYITYAYNYSTIGSRIEFPDGSFYPTKISEIKNPSSIMQMVDSRAGTMTDLGDRGSYIIGYTSTTAGNFHLGQSNLLFVDGHVKSLANARYRLCCSSSSGGIGTPGRPYFFWW